MNNNGDDYFSEEILYLRMYGGWKSPSLFPKYAIGCVIHKELVRQPCLDGIKNLLFDMKKYVHSPLPFCIGSYKFTRVKSAPEFVKELEYFHFGEKKIHRNDLPHKIVNYYVSVWVHFEY